MSLNEFISRCGYLKLLNVLNSDGNDAKRILNLDSRKAFSYPDSRTPYMITRVTRDKRMLPWGSPIRGIPFCNFKVNIFIKEEAMSVLSVLMMAFKRPCTFFMLMVLNIDVSSSSPDTDCKTNAVGRRQFFYPFIGAYMDCPRSLAGCSDIDTKAAVQLCMKCCSLPTGPQSGSNEKSGLPTWAIGVITGSLCVLLIAIAVAVVSFRSRYTSRGKPITEETGTAGKVSSTVPIQPHHNSELLSQDSLQPDVEQR